MIFLKSNAEVAIIKANGQILAEAFEHLAEIIKPGISTKDIDKAVENIILSHSATPSFKNYRGFPCAVCVAINAEVVHGIPTATRILQEGDIIGIDVGAFRNGFHADAARTYAVGNISAEAQRLIDVTKQSFLEGLKQATVGNRVSDISAAVQQCAESAGFGVVRDLLGHGIGRSLHEDPNVPNYGAPGKGPKLRAGLVLAVEPMITQGDYRINTLPDGWTTVTRDGKLSAHYENTIAITADGPVILTIKE